jgi:hypothetical protein
MRVIVLIILFGSLQNGYCQKKNDSSFIKEIRAVERGIYLNIIHNDELFLPNDSIVSGGWIVVEKAAKSTSKNSIISNDLYVSQNFVFERNMRLELIGIKLTHRTTVYYC